MKGLNISNGHSPQIRQNGKLLVRMCRGESHFSQKWPLANVGESGESSVNGLVNGGESGESCIFPKMALLANTRTRQKRQIFGEYSNSTNSPASGHCLVKYLGQNLKI
jgi:hypothetical protein